jgi:hypothetical protein
MVLLQARRPAHAVLPAQQAQPVARARRVANLPSAAQVLPVPHPRGPRQPMQQALPVPLAQQGQVPRPMLQVRVPEVQPAMRAPPVLPAARRAHPVLAVQPAPRPQVLQVPQAQQLPSSRP